MSRKLAVTYIFLVALIASVTTLTIQRLLTPATAVAQEVSGPLEGLDVFANQAGSPSQNFRSFIFVNKQTGDIWVYRNDDFKKHYRVGAMGEELEEVRD